MENTHFIDKEPNRYEASRTHKQQIQSMNEEQIMNVMTKLENAWDLHTKDFSVRVIWGIGNS